MYLCSTTDQYVGSGMHVIVYLGRQRLGRLRGEGALEQNSTFCAHILHPEQQGTTFLLHKHSELQHTDSLPEVPQTRSFV